MLARKRHAKRDPPVATLRRRRFENRAGMILRWRRKRGATSRRIAMALVRLSQRPVRKAVRAVLPSRYAPLVVASIGRSGSTVVFRALQQALAKARFGPLWRLGFPIVGDFAFQLDEVTLRRGVVYKTHALVHELDAASGARAVFVFGPATDSALSVWTCRDRFGEKWVGQHLRNLRADGDISELPDRDILRFEDQLDGWLGGGSLPVLALRYDALWENEDKLSKFVGFPVSLPTKRPRQSPDLVDSDVAERFRRTYAHLDRRIEGLGTAIEVRS